MNLKKILCFVPVFFLSFVSVVSTQAAVSQNYVRTNSETNVSAFSATFNGETASSTIPGSVTQVYFEYGNSSTNLASSTVPVALSSGTLNATGDLRAFSATANDLLQNTSTHFRIVRKVTPETGSTVLYRGSVRSFRTEVNNLAPYVQSLTVKNSSFTTSNCDQNGCTIEIPENLPKYTTIANLVKKDPNNDWVTISIVSGNTDGAFALSSLGDISVSNEKALDFETRTSFTIDIELKDDRKNRLTSHYILKFNLKDIENESKPLPTQYTSTGTVNVPSYTYTGPKKNNYTSSGTLDIEPYKYTAPKNTNYTNQYTSSGNSYTNNYSNSNNNYTVNQNNSTQNEIARLTLIKSILEQIKALQAELDRRIRLGLP